MNQAHPRIWDVLILGAGPAGCATALGLLAARMTQVLLVDKPPTRRFPIGESATPDVTSLLAKFGLDNRLGQMGHIPYHGNLSMWSDDTPRLEHFLLRGLGHGWHLDRAAFDNWLRREVLKHGAQIASPCCIDSIVPCRDGWRIALRGAGETTARVVVDAGGRHSPLARRLGIGRRQLDSLLALATHTSASNGMAGLSLVESCAYGWWYATELPDGRTIVALMTDHDIAHNQGFQNQQHFLQAWRTTQLISQYAVPVSEPVLAVFAAHSGSLHSAAGSRWIAVGDALMGMDPLTSSGLSGALNDAIAAVPVILSLLDGHTDAGWAYAERANTTFRRYLVERRRHYASETRWMDHAFWSRRNGRAKTEMPKPVVP